jgi:hypothetical protein
MIPLVIMQFSAAHRLGPALSCGERQQLSIVGEDSMSRGPSFARQTILLHYGSEGHPERETELHLDSYPSGR